MDSLAELSWRSSRELVQLAAGLGVQLGPQVQQQVETQMQQTLLGLLASGGVGAPPLADPAEPAPAGALPIQQAGGGVAAAAAEAAGQGPLAEGVGSKSR